MDTDTSRKFLRQQVPKDRRWKLLKEGGEAAVYIVSDSQVAKIYHSWNSPLFKGDDAQIEATKQRFREMIHFVR